MVDDPAGLKRKLRPLLLEPREDLLPPFLKPIQHIDVSTPENFEKNYPKICIDLGGTVVEGNTSTNRNNLPQSKPKPDTSSADSAQQNKPSPLGSIGKLPNWVMIVSVSSGLAFLIGLVIIALFIPHPTSFQIFVFRVVLSLAASAFGATIPGFLQIKLPLWRMGLISAGGALGLFVLIYQL